MSLADVEAAQQCTMPAEVETIVLNVSADSGSSGGDELTLRDQPRQTGYLRSVYWGMPHSAHVAVWILAAISVLFALYFARPIAMPIVMAVVLAMLLRPPVRRLRKLHLPDSASAAVLLVAILGICLTALAQLAGPAQEWMAHAPENLQSAGKRLQIVTDKLAMIRRTSEKVEDIADGELSKGDEESAAREEKEDAAETDATWESYAGDGDASEDSGVAKSEGKGETLDATRSGESDPIPVEVESSQAGASVFRATGNLLSQGFVVLVLAYFLLAWGDVLLNGFLHSLSSFGQKRRAVALVHSVEQGISRYLLMVTAINMGLGCVIGTAMWLLGLPNPELWGAMAAVLNFVPYLGAMVGTVIVFLVAVLSMDSLTVVFLAPAAYFVLNSLEGSVITPHILGRTMSLNPVLIVISLVFWSWMWGPGGAILAVPLLAVFRVGLDQFESTKDLGYLFSGAIPD